ncbi:hypothetical protein [Marinobacter salicampi]|uniref:hypothetical protein n=1 Tax=Marinobacter salicampi TaxID=435907 RepID=UPI001F5FB7F6|nr:hypothetical protein [Marinobacter salicampi]
MNPFRLWLPLAITLMAGAAGAWQSPEGALQSWLAVVLTWGALPLGALAILMTHGLTGGRWGTVTRPLWLALAGTLPVFVVAMVVPVLGIGLLFPWTAPASSLPELVQNKLLYLNEPFFVLRSLFYGCVWLALAWGLGVWRGRARRIHAPGLILWLLILTFFGFDWFMSLEPLFYSDIYGLMLATGFGSAALAFGMLVQPGSAGESPRRDLANLWLAVLLGWMFMAISQYIVIWSANLPDEIGWYLARNESPWFEMGWLSFGLFFLVPFLILLSGTAKGRGTWLKTAAVTCLVGHLLQVHWLILPAFGEWQPVQLWLTPVLLVATGAGFLAMVRAGFQTRTERAEVMP